MPTHPLDAAAEPASRKERGMSKISTAPNHGENYEVFGELLEKPIRDSPSLKGIRNKRHRRRTIKKYQRMGIYTYFAPSIQWMPTLKPPA